MKHASLCSLLTIFLVTFTVASPPMIRNRVLGKNPEYGTHITPLITAVVHHTNGPILELGAGDYSTPLLHGICSLTERLLVTTESDKEWLRFFTDLERPWHQFIFVARASDWATIGQNQHWAIVFVDHVPIQRRVMEIERLRSHTDIFVAHDTEKSADVHYRYEPYISTFKYRYDYERYHTRTTLLSDTIDVSQFFK